MMHMVVPDLGDGIEAVDVVAWHFKEGDKVSPEDDVLELVTDKASFCVPAPVKGVLRKICIKAGARARIGDVLGEIEGS